MLHPTQFVRARPWLIAAVMCLSAALLRTYLIQPAAIAHACEAHTSLLCTLRMAVIYTYAFHTIGEVGLVLMVCALVWRKPLVAAATLTVGLCALVFYCYEPGAVAAVAGALLLARAQADLGTPALG